MTAAEVDVCGRWIVQALMVAAMVVFIGKVVDLLGTITGQEAVFQNGAVLERQMPALDLAQGLVKLVCHITPRLLCT